MTTPAGTDQQRFANEIRATQKNTFLSWNKFLNSRQLGIVSCSWKHRMALSRNRRRLTNLAAKREIVTAQPGSEQAGGVQSSRRHGFLTISRTGRAAAFAQQGPAAPPGSTLFPRAPAKAAHNPLVPRTPQCLGDRHMGLKRNARATGHTQDTHRLHLEANHLPKANLYFCMKESLGGIWACTFHLKNENMQ